ncbi:hypothetical protein ACW7EJ_13250, partial [Acinetobacter soli]
KKIVLLNSCISPYSQTKKHKKEKNSMSEEAHSIGLLAPVPAPSSLLLFFSFSILFSSLIAFLRQFRRNESRHRHINCNCSTYWPT